jgi:hypothetical protein
MAKALNHKKTFPLKNLPVDIDKIIKTEQTRLEVENNLVLKREEVYYRIVREWQQNKKPGYAIT